MTTTPGNNTSITLNGNLYVRKILLHTAFWIFILAYEMDYLSDLFDSHQAIRLSMFELLLYVAEAYINLLLLIPWFLEKGKIRQYCVSVICLLMAVYGAYLLSGLNDLLLSENKMRSALTLVINHGLIILISFLYWYVTKYEKEKRKAVELENQKLKSELDLLKSQLSPHFLFNTLNGIYSLILIDPEKASHLLDNLSAVLRYSIYSSQLTLVPLSEEINAINNYLNLQKSRLQDSAESIRFQTSGIEQFIEIPPLLLLTVVENAFKHGDIFENENAFIEIQLNLTESSIYFQVNNSYQLKTSHPGVGLDNIKKQLAIAYPGLHTISILDKDPVYSITIQFQYAAS